MYRKGITCQRSVPARQLSEKELFIHVMMLTLKVVTAAAMLFAGLSDTNPVMADSREFNTAHAGSEFFRAAANAFSTKEVKSGLAAVASVESGRQEDISEISTGMTKKRAISANDASLEVTGLWLSADKRGIIHIYEQGGLFYGRLVWLKEPEDDRGNEVLDSENPDPEKQDQPILGLQMVFGLEYSDGEWRNGKIYDPESGKTYSARLQLNGSDRMDLRGYIRLPVFGRTESWTRVDTFPDDGKIWSGFGKG
jgi:uncharacterized protein (DUF2147 family)